MAVPLKYVGSQSRYFDTVDGSREQWTPGDSSDVSDAAALGLIATGLFAAVEGARDAYTLAQLNALAAAGGLVPFATYIPRGESPAYQMWASSASEIGTLGNGAPYLGPQTMAALQAGAYADGTPELAALAKDTVVYDPAGLCSYVPNAAGTAWTVGRAGQEVSIADLATRMSLGRPVPVGVQLIDPETKQVYGQSDGAGGYTDAASPPALRLTESTNFYGTSRTQVHGRFATMVPPGENKAFVADVFGNGEAWTNLPLAAMVPITASISGTVMTVTAVGVATNPNGSTLAGAVNRGHYVTGDAGIPAGTHIIFNPSDTGDHGAGTYSLSADCGTIASKPLSLSCANGVGGVMERVSDSFFGSAGSADPDSMQVWRLSIKPTHRVTAGHGRAQLRGEYMYPRKRYRVEMMFRLHYSSSSGWQTIGSATTIPTEMAIAAISPTDISGFDAATQYTTSGVFAVNYQRGGIRAFLRTPDEEYAIKAGDGFWSWSQEDERYKYDQEDYMYILKGLEPIKLVYEVFLDERMKSEGGKGWLKCWINNRLILDHQGPTLFPAGRLDGLVPPVQARCGLYDVSYPVVADNTLCSTIKSTAAERNLHVKYFRVLEMS